MISKQIAHKLALLEEYPSQYIYRLSEMDQKVYNYIVVKKCPQKDVAKFLGITQGAVSSRLNKILRRLQFMQTMSPFDLDQIEEDLKGILTPLERAVLKSLAETTCQQETALRVNNLFNLEGKKALNQIKARYKFQMAWSKVIGQKNPKYEKYVRLFKYIQDNLYMLHDLKLPQFERGAVCI